MHEVSRAFALVELAAERAPWLKLEPVRVGGFIRERGGIIRLGHADT
jgi:hypothetical protein